MSKALIVGDSTGALAAARDLGRAGWTVGVASKSRLGWASASRWITHWHPMSVSLLDDEEGFLNAINRLMTAEGYEIVFGASDAAVLTLSKNRRILSAIVPYGPHEQVVNAFDKLKLVRAASQCRIATPRTLEARDNNLGSLGYPAVIKQRLHWTSGQIEAIVVNNFSEARDAVRKIREANGQPLVQEYIPGHMLIFVSLVDKRHCIIANYSQIVTHQGRSESGSIARARTIHSDELLTTNVQELMSNTEWFGIVNLQFLVPKNQEPVLIDFNGRMFNSLAMARACGLNLFDAWGRLATRGEAPPLRATIGPRYHSMEGDIRRILAQSPRTWIGGILSSLYYAPQAIHPILSVRDPGPTVAYWMRLPRRAITYMLMHISHRHP